MSYTYIDDDQIDSELRCPICNDPFRSPVNCIQCGHTFCEECIQQWYQQQTSCPVCRERGYLFVPVITRVLLNQLNRLLVQCILCEQRNIQRCYFVDHLSIHCPKVNVNCRNDCRWKGYREDLEKHLNDCRPNRSRFFRWLTCRLL